MVRIFVMASGWPIQFLRNWRFGVCLSAAVARFNSCISSIVLGSSPTTHPRSLSRQTSQRHSRIQAFDVVRDCSATASQPDTRQQTVYPCSSSQHLTSSARTNRADHVQHNFPACQEPRPTRANATMSQPGNSGSQPSPSPSRPPSPGALNRLTPHAAHALLHACCNVSSYATRMLSQRPFTSFDHVLEVSRSTWNSLSPESWLAAFEAHPRLTSRHGKHTRRGADLGARWARKEASVLHKADASVVAEIRDLEDRYMQKHGFPVVLCVPGRTPEQVREEIRSRLANKTDQEMYEAADEQIKITEIRLRKATTVARIM